METLSIITGLLILFLGGEFLIKGAISVAWHLNISRILVSSVIVGFGTSMPEMTVSVGAMVQDSSAIAIANVVGSNIANILFILGISALISPIILKDKFINRDIFVMFFATILLVVLSFLDIIGFMTGLIMLIALVSYITYSYFQDRDNFSSKDIKTIGKDLGFVKNANLLTSIIVCALGFTILIIGSSLMLDGAISIANHFQISEEIIGLGVVALGSCLPELATATVASYRKHGNIVVASIIGSNIFNILSIVGVMSLIDSIKMPEHILKFDLWILILITSIISIIFFRRIKLGRILGLIFLMSYFFYFYKLFY